MVCAIRNSQYKRGIKKKLFKRNRGHCDLCYRELTFSTATIDHKIPLSRGGTWILENLQLCCLECNTLKGNLTTNEYLDKISKENLQ